MRNGIPPKLGARGRSFHIRELEVVANSKILHFKGDRLREHIFFIGIGGIGVSALAQVAQARGAKVSGSDPNADPLSNPAVARLHDGGATLFREHSRENLASDVSLVVASAAIGEANPEMQTAKERGIRVVSRAEYLGELMAAHKGIKIAIAGTHGKTTTTGFVGTLLQEAGLDPTIFVGGEVAQIGGNVRIGSETGPFVAEACEAYDSFHSLRPDIAVITNLEADHLDHYGTFEKVEESFVKFLDGVSGGAQSGVVICSDDKAVRHLIEKWKSETETSTKIHSYGIDSEDAESIATNIRYDLHPTFEWKYPDAWKTPVKLSVPGRHNILNALAAATVGRLLGVSEEGIAQGLAAFHGATRRQDILGEVELGTEGSVIVMDDYAHHPTEISATLDALRGAYPHRRLIAIFQPHLYSRTRDFLPEFATALATADALIVTDIYAARELPIPEVRAADIVNLAIKKNPQIPALFLPDKKDIPKMLAALIKPNDIAVFLGAGDIRTQGERFLLELESGEQAI